MALISEVPLYDPPLEVLRCECLEPSMAGCQLGCEPSWGLGLPPPPLPLMTGSAPSFPCAWSSPPTQTAPPSLYLRVEGCAVRDAASGDGKDAFSYAPDTPVGPLRLHEPLPKCMHPPPPHPHTAGVDGERAATPSIRSPRPNT